MQSHRKLQAAMRKFVDAVIYPDAQLREEDGKRPSLEVIAKMAYACVRHSAYIALFNSCLER